jgi:hypothetical protein
VAIGQLLHSHHMMFERGTCVGGDFGKSLRRFDRGA